MRRIMFFRIGGKEVHLPKLIGAFILFAAVLMFLGSVANMFDSWDNLKNLDTCLEKVNLNGPEYSEQVKECKMALYYTNGIYLKPGQGQLTVRQFWSALMQPIAAVLFWLAVLFIGWIAYNTGDLVLPIEEKWRDIPEKKIRKKKVN